jgi:hypothetical protein
MHVMTEGRTDERLDELSDKVDEGFRQVAEGCRPALR